MATGKIPREKTDADIAVDLSNNDKGEAYERTCFVGILGHRFDYHLLLHQEASLPELPKVVHTPSTS
jgi:thiamine pyrophosphokinase